MTACEPRLMARDCHGVEHDRQDHSLPRELGTRPTMASFPRGNQGSHALIWSMARLHCSGQARDFDFSAMRAQPRRESGFELTMRH